MQCSNCGFQNMPGSEACGRCGSTLGLATAVIDVHPPRAGRWTKRVRRMLPMSRAYYGARDAIGTTASRRLAPYFDGPMPPAGFLFRLALPGWAHFYLGRRTRGWFFVIAFLVFFMPGITMLGTVAGNFLLGMAFSVHASAGLDVIMQLLPDLGMRNRIVRSITISLLLGVLVYLPAGWLLTRYASPRRIQNDAEPFRRGDVVLVHQWAYLRDDPQVGDAVLFDMTEYLERTHGPTNNVINRLYRGEHIDRVLAGPGSRVHWQKGRLLVNGVASPLRPLRVAALPDELEIDVPRDRYLILPTTSPMLGPGTSTAVWERISLIPAQHVYGRVYLRNFPLSRWEWIR